MFVNYRLKWKSVSCGDRHTAAVTAEYVPVSANTSAPENITPSDGNDPTKWHGGNRLYTWGDNTRGDYHGVKEKRTFGPLVGWPACLICVGSTIGGMVGSTFGFVGGGGKWPNCDNYAIHYFKPRLPVLQAGLDMAMTMMKMVVV